jgi:gliding motility-associated-like protein
MNLFTEKKARFCFILLFLLSHSSWIFSQTCPTSLPSNQWVRGAFLAPATVCVGQPITVNDLSRGSNIRYIYDYARLSDTTRAVTRNTNSYNRAGIFLIVQVGRINNRPSFACAQIRVVDPVKPNFTLTSCGNATARLTIQNPNYDTYLIDWGDGTPIQTYLPNQPTPTHIYSRNQAFVVRITGFITGGNCGATSDLRTFTPVGSPPILPTFTKATVLDEVSAELSYLNPSNSTNYALQQRIFPSPTFANAPNVAPTPSTPEWKVKPTGLRTSTSMYCFRLSQQTSCAGSTITLNSNEVCTLPLNLTAQPYQNVLVWRPYQSTRFKQYVIKRDGVTLVNITNMNTITYTDTRVECGRAYKYQIVAEFNGTPELISSSLVKEITTQPTTPPPPLTNVVVSVTNDKTAQITATAPANVRVRRYIFKTPSGELSNPTRTLADTSNRPGLGSVCYEATYEDVCGRVVSSARKVCTVHLTTRGEILRWTEQLPFTGVLQEYRVQRLDAQGRVLRTEYRGRMNEWDMANTTAPEQEVIYRIQTVATNGASSFSNVVRYFRPMKIFVPSAFTPNGDNTNETFEVQGQFIARASLTILNRWGHAIFQTDDWKTGWSGTTAGGQALESGTYVYVIEATDTKGNSAVQRGEIALLR